jgi:23S rRNA pseudouridine2605 synthase
MKVRLQKYLAEAGVASRRHAEDLIREGRVTIDGRVAQLGESVESEQHVVAVDGRAAASETKEYWLLNKPLGVVSTASDPEGRPTVVECVPTSARVFPVGRLDVNSTGLLLLTNDGELAARMLHPSHHVEKEYAVTVWGEVTASELAELRTGVRLEDGSTAPARVRVTGHGQAGRARDARARAITDLRVTLHEGRKRQVRRMLEAVGHRVITLHRVRFGALTDAELPVGKARRLAKDEIDKLRRAAGLTQ